MARPLRIECPDTWYHVTCRGNERRAMFRDDRDLERFLEIVNETRELFGVEDWV
jgi:putative transposase